MALTDAHASIEEDRDHSTTEMRYKVAGVTREGRLEASHLL